MSLDGHHVHPRPRGDLVLCDGRCGARLPLPLDFEVRAVVDGLASSAAADRYAVMCGWLVTTSMLRSFHWCGECRKGVE